MGDGMGNLGGKSEGKCGWLRGREVKVCLQGQVSRSALGKESAETAAEKLFEAVGRTDKMRIDLDDGRVEPAAHPDSLGFQNTRRKAHERQGIP